MSKSSQSSYMKIGIKQVIKGQSSNIEAFLNMATPEEIKAGLDWYLAANRQCEEIFLEFGGQFTINTIAGMAAALSPRNRWSRNLNDVRSLLKNDNATVGTFHRNKEKATAIKRIPFPDDDEILSIIAGDKVQNFYRNLVNPYSEEYVTVDSHAIGVWLGSRAIGISAKGKAYDHIASEYIEVAQEKLILPNQLQAITWLAYRRVYNIK